jgi:hypothetical protein
MSKLIGTNPNQVPSNADLGSAAYIDKKEFLLSKGSSISAIDAIIPDTTVDLFVYDTSKDSDGGAWRKRTQHTSWYNEKLNTTTRGSRKEFPSVAVIVIKNNLVTIYDADDPNIPMWMVFEGSAPSWAGGHIIWADNQAVVALNATIVVPDDEYGVTVINFLKDGAHRLHSASNGGEFENNIEGRNTDSGYANNNTINIRNNYTHKAIMKVMPNSRVDSVTGLPVPTIAISSDGGVSVVKDDDSVIDFVGPGSPYVISKTMNFTNDGRLRLGLDGGGQRYYRTYIIGGADRSVNQWDPGADDGLTLYQNYANGDAVMLGSNVSGANEKAIKTSSGITFFDENLSTANHSLIAHTNSSYSTGWMVGDIRIATLSDTTTGDVLYDYVEGFGDFTTGSAWTVDSGWSTSGNVATKTAGTSNYITKSIGSPFVYGHWYQAEFDLLSGSGSSVLLVNRHQSGVIKPYSNSLTNVDVAFFQGSSGGSKYYAIWKQNANNKDRIQLYSGSGVSLDNLKIYEISAHDRVVHNGNNHGITKGRIAKTPVSQGSELLSYSGFNGTTNYLLYPNTPSLDLGSGDFSIMFWAKSTSLSATQLYFSIANPTVNDNRIAMYALSNGDARFFLRSGGTEDMSSSGANDVRPNTWQHFCGTRRGNNLYLYIDGIQRGTVSTTKDITQTGKELKIGTDWNGSADASESEIALFRYSRTAVLPEQIKKIHTDEKSLFQDNAQVTIYGTSDSVTGFSYDDDTELLHAGTNAGRSVFQGLRRIDNTTDGVSTAISAVNGMVVEE